MYKNKLRSYYYINNIFNIILYYKDIDKKKNINKIVKLKLNFKIFKENSFKIIENIIDIYFFFKLFGNICCKNLKTSTFCKQNQNKKNLNLRVMATFESIITKKKIFIFFNYIIFFLIQILQIKIKKKFLNFELKNLKILNYIFFNFI